MQAREETQRQGHTEPSNLQLRAQFFSQDCYNKTVHPYVLLPCNKAKTDMPIHVLIFESYFE